MQTQRPEGHGRGNRPVGQPVALRAQDDRDPRVRFRTGRRGRELVQCHRDVRQRQGDRVSEGQELVRVDRSVIEQAGYPLTTPVLITNTAYGD